MCRKAVLPAIISSYGQIGKPRLLPDPNSDGAVAASAFPAIANPLPICEIESAGESESDMQIRTSGSGCGGFLLGWCLFVGILAFLAGWGRWGMFGTVIPGYWVIVLIVFLGVGLVAWLAN